MPYITLVGGRRLFVKEYATLRQLCGQYREDTALKIALTKIHKTSIDNTIGKWILKKYSKAIDWILLNSFYYDYSKRYYTGIIVEFFNDELEDYYDAYLIDNEGKDWALDFIDWHKILDLPIKTNVNLTEPEILAQVLWEITYHGWTNEAIKEKFESLYSHTKNV